MAAYAALTSLNNLLHQIQHHPSPPISIDKQQLKSLTQNASFLLEFLETYRSPVSDGDEADPLEMRIADVAYAAEDVIESYIVDNIKLAAETTHDHDDDEKQIVVEDINCINFHKDMQKVIGEMDLMEREVTAMVGEKATIKPRLQKNLSTSGVGSSRSSIMVGFEDVKLQILDKLTSERLDRQVIPVVGMSGIGKTTLTRHVYAHTLVKEHFDMCAWATISQNYSSKEILCDLISQTKTLREEEWSDMSESLELYDDLSSQRQRKKRLSGMSEDELGLELHKCLFGRRFLIVMDDMWSIDAWDEIQRFFPDNGNRSRIVVTTRLSKLGFQLDKSYCLKMKFLDDDSSWDLFVKIVFGEEGCPTELEKIGKKIVETCKGLPLPIVVIGGLLKNLEHTQECWEYVSKQTSSLVNSENEDSCLKLLKMSYNHLPVYLKPCFLYMGVFENSAVRVSWLVKLWVSEGFLKPVSGTSLETAARDYLNDLVDRNLVLVHEFGSRGTKKFYGIHDLLRDLCWREAGKEGFYDVIGQHKSPSRQQRRVYIRESTSKEEVDDALKSMPLARSFICDRNRGVSFPESRLLRILDSYGTSQSQYYELDELFGFVNSRFLAVEVQFERSYQFSSSIGLLWNLQTLIISHSSWVSPPLEIWKMSQLRHVAFLQRNLRLPSVPSGNVVSMKNLQTLKGLYYYDPSKEYKLFNLFLNIKKLELAELPLKLKLFTKLESCHCWRMYDVRERSLPDSLKKLSLGSHVPWMSFRGMLEKIGALPLLQKLKLERAKFEVWETNEGQFPSLKYLEVKRCTLKSWLVESSHFPRLEQLHLYGLKELEEIPNEIGEIATLQSILLEFCSEAVVESAKKIAEEQEDLRVRVVLFNTEENKALRRLASPNFVVQIVHLAASERVM